MTITRVLLLLGIVALSPQSALGADPCAVDAGVTLQVLGSGGPIADDGRASSGYLVWVDGRARALIDVGGGTFLRYGEAGAKFEDLVFIGLSHFHTDHSADFITLLKSGIFSKRTGELTVAGPSGRAPFPGLDQYLDTLLSPDDGVYGYLSGYLNDGPNTIRGVEVSNPSQVFGDSELVVHAQHVPHGIVPAIAFRVEVYGKSIVFASDQNGSDPEFAKFAADADLLLMHMVIPEDAGIRARQLHAVPSAIGKLAAEAKAKQLVLSHFMARSLRALPENLSAIRKNSGLDPLLADDLACFHLQ